MKKLNRKLRLYRQTIGLKPTLGVLQDHFRGIVRTHQVSLPGWPHPVGLRLPGSDIQVVRQVFRTKEYVFDVAKPPKIIIDAGANIGLAAIWFTNLYPDARIIAIEAEKSNYSLLCDNVKPYPNITPVHAALWDSDGTLEVRDTGVGNWGFMTSNADEAAANVADRFKGTAISEVESLTVDTLIKRYQLGFVDILKIDIEGAELEVFRTSAPWLNSVGAMIVELHENMKPGCTESFRKGSQGFDAEWVQGENVFLTRKGVLVPPGDAIRTTACW